MIRDMIQRITTLLFIVYIYSVNLVIHAVEVKDDFVPLSSDNHLEGILPEVRLKLSERTLQEYKQHAAMPIPKAIPLPSLKNKTPSVHSIVEQSIEQLRYFKTLIANTNTKVINLLIQNLKTKTIDDTVLLEQNSNSFQGNDTNYITDNEIERMLSPQVVLAESETILSDWIKSMMRDEIESVNFDEIDIGSVQNMNHGNSSSRTDTCMKVEYAANEVYDALLRFTKDGIGQTDYTESIVHLYTSPTHVFDDIDTPTLGTVSWNKYIPQDWENLLPIGWKSWNIRFIPDHIYHSFGILWGSNSQLATTAIQTSPPEAILQPSILPGHCWPVSMKHNGLHPAKVTIKLQSPIIVTAITIDHTTKSLLQHPKEQIQSAPHRMKVYGYKPCKDNRNEDNNICHGLEFDLTSKVFLTEITYNIHQDSNVQTFPIDSNIKQHEVVDNETDSSCSSQTKSCYHSSSKDSPVVVSAISVEIIDNWGNQEFTCLYRVRVHGKPSY